MRILFIILICFTIPLRAQFNLIPNGSFEILTNCPSASYNLSSATPWKPYLQSPDVFATCATSPLMGVPQNGPGYKVPSTGLNYAGYCNWQNTQEILGVKLCDSLTIGEEYFVSFKIALASDYCWTGAFSHHGMKVSTKNLSPQQAGVTTQTNNIVSNFAHVYSTKVVTDTLNWTTIKGTFIADSSYKYAYFGILFQRPLVTYSVVYGTDIGAAYYYIDDVCLSNDSMACMTGTQNLCHVNTNTVVIDTVTTDLKYPTNFKSFQIAPNPAQNYLSIDGEFNALHYKIINSNGTTVLIGIINNKGQINIESLPTGIYVIHIESEQARRIFRILKQ